MKALDKEVYGYIYLIKNTNTNKSYIGQTINPAKRFTEHITGRGSKPLFESIIRSSGEGIEFYIINECYDKHSLDVHEAYYILHGNSIHYGYNIRPGNVEVPMYFIPNEFKPLRCDIMVDKTFIQNILCAREIKAKWEIERRINPNKELDKILELKDIAIAEKYQWKTIKDALTYVNNNNKEK